MHKLLEKKSDLLSILIILIFIPIFFYPVFKQRYPLPTDLLVGAYYPWYESTWGYSVGVPYKNATMSDVFSQLYIWKSLAADSLRHGQLPLWNPTSYSGYPLLANFQTGALYPFISFLVLFGNLTGWTLLLMFGSFASAISMYIFLRILKFFPFPSLLGALTFAYSGFAIVWMEFATASQALIWLPALLSSVELARYNRRSLLLIPGIIFFLVSSGHFQTLFFGLILTTIYFIFRLKRKNIKLYFFLVVIGLLISSLQLLPTLELSSLSIRADENYIRSLGFGLLPLSHGVTLFAPDFFGNPGTKNYWGFLNYHETIFYSGILSALALIFSLYPTRRSKPVVFFTISTLISLSLGFDNPLSKLIYKLNLPGLSDSAASRIFVIFTLSCSVLVAWICQTIPTLPIKKIVHRLWPSFAFFAIFFIFTFVLKKAFSSPDLESLRNNMGISLRNLIFPFLLLLGFTIVTLLKNTRFFYFLLLLLLFLDLFRFSSKYLPFTEARLIFPKEPILEFITSQPGLFRIERLKDDSLPPNTWAAYGLQSPGGYDPLAIKDYVNSYNHQLNKATPPPSRYSELEEVYPKDLAFYNVKYLLTRKKTATGQSPGPYINGKINPADWNVVFETPSMAVAQNKHVLPRAHFFKPGQVSINSYTSQKIDLSYTTPTDNELLLADSYYPGWKATINDKKTTIKNYRSFRLINVPPGTGTIVFSYLPPTILIASLFTLAGSLLWLSVFKSIHKF